MKTLLMAVLTFTAVMASSAFAAQEINQPQGLQEMGCKPCVDGESAAGDCPGD